MANTEEYIKTIKNPKQKVPKTPHQRILRFLKSKCVAKAKNGVEVSVDIGEFIITNIMPETGTIKGDVYDYYVLGVDGFGDECKAGSFELSNSEKAKICKALSI